MVIIHQVAAGCAATAAPGTHLALRWQCRLSP